MKKALANILYGLLFFEVAVGLVLGFMAYFIRSHDRTTGMYFDGIGRQLEQTPLIVRMFLSSDSLWAGWGYFAIDSIVFLVGIVAGGYIAQLASNLSAEKKSSQ